MEREQEARALYASLTPDERRKSFQLRLTYRTVRDRLLDSEDRVTFPRYALLKWLRILGPEAFGLWLIMRDMARVEATQADSRCWPEQGQLARIVGISKNTLRKRLAVLERHGFIRKERRRDKVDERWIMVQVPNDYEVFADLPLVEADAIQALAADIAEEARRSEFKNCTQSVIVPNALSSNFARRDSELKSCTQSSECNQPVSSSEFRTCAPNVTNANLSNVRKSSFREDPRVRALPEADKRARESLAHEIGETLRRMEGSKGLGPHESLGLHRRLAYLMPETLLRRALMATRDAVDDARAGKTPLTSGPSAYFAGTAFTLADEAGIALGVKRSRRAQQPGPHAAMRACGHPPNSPDATQGFQPAVSDSRQMLRDLVDSLHTKLSPPTGRSRATPPSRPAQTDKD